MAKKRGKAKTYRNWLIVAGIAIVFMIAALSISLSVDGKETIPTDEEMQGEQQLTPSDNSCKETSSTTLTLNVQNSLNTTGSETFDVDGRLIGTTSGNREVVSDTTDGSYTINCGEEYELVLFSSDGDEGDNSIIKKALIGQNAKVTDEGTVKFLAEGAKYSLHVAVDQHGVLEFKAKDLDLDEYMYDSSDADATDYETAGVTFKSTTDNTTAKAIGSDGYFNVMLEARSTRGDTNFNDHYTLVLLTAPVDEWSIPGVEVDGAKVTDVSGALTAEENRAFSSYDYIYKIDKPILDGQDGIDVEVYMEALSGVNPSTDIQLDFASAGRYLSVDGVSYDIGAAKDDSSTTKVYTVQDVTFDIS